MNDLIREAITWAEQGIPTFPCSADKRPLTTNGFYDASTDPATVRSMFEFYGDAAAMIGGRMGDGIFAVDVDLYKGDVPKAWLKAQIDDGTMPDTRVHQTKSGGLHFLYEGDSGCCVPTDGVEIKGDGGYIILPGTDGYSVKSAGMAVAPDSLIEMIRTTLSHTRGSSEAQLKNKILSGADFHAAMTTLAARWADKGSDQEGIQANLFRLLEGSVASHPGHERHSRWRKVMSDDNQELSRIAFSAYRKFNPEAIHAEAGEMAGDMLLQLKEVEDKLFLPPPPFVEETKKEIHLPEGVDPFADDGYDAHENVNILDAKFVARPILVEDETTLLSADPKTGKTVVLIDLGMSIACGYDYGSFQVPEAGPVLYFGLEGRAAIRKRVEAWKKVTRETKKLPDFIPMKVVERSVNFYSDDAQDLIVAKIAAYNKYCIDTTGLPVKAIMIDTLTRAMIGGDQNSADDTAKLFNIVSLIRDKGVTAAVVFVHHNSKAGQTRGSSNIEAEVDMVLGMTKKNDVATLKIVRARSVEDGAAFSFKLRGVALGQNVQGYEVEGVVAEPLGEVEQVKVEDADAQAIAQRRKAITQLGSGTHTVDVVVEAWYKAGLLKGRTVRGTAMPPIESSAPVQKALLTVASDPGGAVYGDYLIKPVIDNKKVVVFKVGAVTY